MRMDLCKISNQCIFENCEKDRDEETETDNEIQLALVIRGR